MTSTIPVPVLRPAQATRQPIAMHVVHALLTLGVGGLERMVIDLARVGSQCGQRVTVLCLESAGVLADEARSAGATVLALDKHSGRSPALTQKIAALLQQLRPDVIHTHQIGALWYVGPAAGDVPVLHTEHSDHAAMSPDWRRQLRTRLFYRMTARHASAFCCVSESVARSMTRWATVPRSKVSVVLNGIDTGCHARLDANAGADVRRALGIPIGRTVVGTVGRLTEVKRQDLLLRAVASVPEQSGRPHVMLVGDGPERQTLWSLARALNLVDRTHFCGYQSSPERFFAAMDIFVLSSRLEGLPLSLLEAWAARLPVVATAVGGIPSVVQDNVNGLLVPNGDTGRLTSAIERLLAEPATATRLAEAATKTVREHYSLERMARDYANHYCQIKK